jgi:5,5'-dehydrodivanillate O-demethylase
MLTAEQNERLTRVGPGTPCGELLRRYWQPLCPTGEITPEKPKKRVRIMGEDLLVFLTREGTYACIAEHCPHRRASLYLGFIEPGGIRCAYHGWKFGADGHCQERPFEDRPNTGGRIRTRSYPVQELGGLLFTYMGPDPESAPLLPRWDVLARTDRRRTISIMPVHKCNWLQIQENTVDSVHTYYLHGELSEVLDFPAKAMGAYFHRPIQSYDWAPCDWGIEKSLVYGGDKPEVEVRPPLIFPNLLRIPEGPVEALHFRVPIDDAHTRVIWVGLLPGPKPTDTTVPYEYVPMQLTEDGDIQLDTFYRQDQAVWETQGVIFDRTQEHLGKSDGGIVLYRRMLAEQIDRVEQGKEPNVAVVRDPAKNEIIAFTSATSPWRAPGSELVHPILDA